MAWLPTAAAFDFSGDKALEARFRDGGQLQSGRVLPYPYAHPGTAAPGQLAWLEHNLLFLFKQPVYTDADRTGFPAGVRWVTELRIE